MRADLEIPPSTEEAFRHSLEHEMDMRTHSLSDMYSGVRPVSSTLRSKPARRHDPWPLDDVDGSVNEPRIPNWSPGNHSVLLATPKGHTPTAHTHMRPTLHLRDDFNISRMVHGTSPSIGAGLRAQERSMRQQRPKEISAVQNAPRSRHSSGETAVNDDDSAYAKAYSPIPESVRWADRELGKLTDCVASLEREAHRLRGAEHQPDNAVGEPRLLSRVAALEKHLARQDAEILRVTNELASHASESRMRAAEAAAVRAADRDRFARVDADLDLLFRRLEVVAEGTPSLEARRAEVRAAEERAAEAHVARVRAEEQAQWDAEMAQRGFSAPSQAASARPAAPPPRVSPIHTQTPCPSHDESIAASLLSIGQRIMHLAQRMEPGDNPRQADKDHASFDRLCDMFTAPPSSESQNSKHKIEADLRQRQAADAKADELLQRLSTPGGPCVLTTDEVELLKNLYTHHLSVFVRQRAVYRELADNLKDIEPDTDPDERDVLANHVCKSVQLLVAEAQRIDMLRHCLTTLGHL